jgi:hypothetical protein
MKRLVFTLAVAALAAAFGPHGRSAMAQGKAPSPQQSAAAAQR